MRNTHMQEQQSLYYPLTELRGSKPVGLREGDSPSFVRPASRIGTRHRAFAPTHAQPQDTGAPRLRPW